MEKVVKKSLRIKITQEINELNRNNIQFYAMLNKLHNFDQSESYAASQRLEAIRIDLKEKIRSLATNVDLLYEVQERKIKVIITELSKLQGTEALLEQINRCETQIGELQQKLKTSESRNNAIQSLNQELKQKNVLLVQQIQSWNKKHKYSNDANYVSHERSNQELEKMQLASLEDKSVTENELTFNRRDGLKPKEFKVKSEQSSFYSTLIREQNSFDLSYGLKEESKKLGFGCLPRPLEAGRANEHNIAVGSQSRVKHHDQRHRLQFLINNLKQAHETTQTSEHSFNQSPVGCLGNAASPGVVRKYMI